MTVVRNSAGSSARGAGVPEDGSSGRSGPPAGAVEAHCIPQLDATDRQGAIEELAACWVASGTVTQEDAARIVLAVIAREEEGTTGIGRGVAMPHTRSHAEVPGTLLAVGLQADGLDWDATDGAPVHVVFLIASRTPEAYLGVASRVARVARDSAEMRALRRQTTAAGMATLLGACWA